MLLFVTRVVVPDKIEFWFITDIINDWKTLTIFVHVNCLRSLACGNESSPLAFVRILGWSTRHYNATTTPLQRHYACAGRVQRVWCAGRVHCVRCAGRVQRVRCAGRVQRVRCAGRVQRV